jgi:hypothetical protein
MTAPVASGWSGCRVGLAPTGKRRLVTVHTLSGHSGSRRRTRAHVSAAGAKGGRKMSLLGRSHGGFSTKIHLKTDFDGFPIAFILTGGEASDSPQFATLLDIGPEITPRAALADKGYDSKANRAAARKRGAFAPRFLIDQTENRYRISIYRDFMSIGSIRRNGPLL